MSPVPPEILGRLLDEHAGALELYAAQWADNPADVVQEAFIQLARQTEPPQHIVPWLYRVVRNGAISSGRKSGRQKKHESAAGLMRAWFVADEANELDAGSAAEALGELPAEQREVIVARLWGGLSFEEIALVADVSSSTLHRRYQAGLDSLRKKLGVSWLTENNSI